MTKNANQSADGQIVSMGLVAATLEIILARKSGEPEKFEYVCEHLEMTENQVNAREAAFYLLTKGLIRGRTATTRLEDLAPGDFAFLASVEGSMREYLDEFRMGGLALEIADEANRQGGRVAWVEAVLLLEHLQNEEDKVLADWLDGVDLRERIIADLDADRKAGKLVHRR